MRPDESRHVECPKPSLIGAEALHGRPQQRHRSVGGVRVVTGQDQRVVGGTLLGREMGLIEAFVGRRVDKC